MSSKKRLPRNSNLEEPEYLIYHIVNRQRQLGLNATELETLTHLVLHTYGGAHPPDALIVCMVAEETGRTERQVMTILQRIASRGLITISKGGGAWGPKLDYRTGKILPIFGLTPLMATIARMEGWVE